MKIFLCILNEIFGINRFMKQIYFDQNITEKFFKNLSFSENFCKEQNITSDNQLIITPFSLIELSGRTIKGYLKDKTKYKINCSDSLSNQLFEAYDFYENNIRDDIIPFLESGLKDRENRIQKAIGDKIRMWYLNYLSSEKGFTEIPTYIAYDRVCDLPLGQFKYTGIDLDIRKIAFAFLIKSVQIPILRLVIKFYKKIRPNNQRDKEDFIDPMRQLVEKSDLQEGKDLIDTEIIQLAVMGYDGHPVCFYTKDSSEKIKARLELLHLFLYLWKSDCKSRLKDGIDVLKSKNQAIDVIQKIASLKFHFGKIVIIDDSGHTEETIDVQKFISSKMS